MTNDIAAGLVRILRIPRRTPEPILTEAADLIEQQAAEIERLRQHQFDYHETFIDAVGRAAETLGFPLNKRDYNELRGCASQDGILAELTEKVAAKIERLSTELAMARKWLTLAMGWMPPHNATRVLIRDYLIAGVPSPTAVAASHLHETVAHAQETANRILADEAPASGESTSPSPRPEPGGVAGNAAAANSLPQAALGEDAAKLTPEVTKAAEMEANTPIPDRRTELESQIVVTRFGELTVMQLDGRVAYVDSCPGPDGDGVVYIAGVSGAYDDEIYGETYDSREAAEKAARDWLIDRAEESWKPNNEIRADQQ